METVPKPYKIALTDHIDLVWFLYTWTW